MFFEREKNKHQSLSCILLYCTVLYCAVVYCLVAYYTILPHTHRNPNIRPTISAILCPTPFDTTVPTRPHLTPSHRSSPSHRTSQRRGFKLRERYSSTITSAPPPPKPFPVKPAPPEPKPVSTNTNITAPFPHQPSEPHPHSAPLQPTPADATTRVNTSRHVRRSCDLTSTSPPRRLRDGGSCASTFA